MSEYINNSQARKEQLKQLVLELHRGGDLDDIKRRFARLVGAVSAVEIAQMEQELIAEGLPAEEVRELCDVHVALFREGLTEGGAPEMTPGHPVHTFKFENLAVSELLNLLSDAVEQLPDEGAYERARTFAEQLAEIDKLYSRKENLLFPFLEAHGVGGPTAVMWGIHDDIRGQVKEFRAALRHGEAHRAKEIFPHVAEAIRSMAFKEENILFPTALRILSDAEWLAIRNQSDEIGYCLVRPGDRWRPDVEPAAPPRAAAYGEPAEGATAGQVPLDTGSLTPEQVRLIFNHLPVDTTFVDADDTVRFFSEGTQGRVFVRTPAVIGRQVQNCHPPHSVHVVNRILDEFRAGTRDAAEFWIQMQGRFIHIRYYAVRDGQGTYQGALEVVQDVTGIRALAGERRLLDEAVG